MCVGLVVLGLVYVCRDDEDRAQVVATTTTTTRKCEANRRTRLDTAPQCLEGVELENDFVIVAV